MPQDASKHQLFRRKPFKDYILGEARLPNVQSTGRGGSRQVVSFWTDGSSRGGAFGFEAGWQIGYIDRVR